MYCTTLVLYIDYPMSINMEDIVHTRPTNTQSPVRFLSSKPLSHARVTREYTVRGLYACIHKRLSYTPVGFYIIILCYKGHT